MKDIKHIQSFGEFKENLNISDVSDSLNILSDYFYDNGFLTKMYIKDKDIYLMDFKRGNSTLSGMEKLFYIYHIFSLKTN